MRDGVDPWRAGDLAYLEREINYWTGPVGYQACATGVQAAQDYAARHGMDRVVVLPAWACCYSLALKDAVAKIDPAGLVTDCDGAEIVIMPTGESLERFVNWCKQHVTWNKA
jgi:hypothetical protein